MIPKIIHYCWLSDDPIPQKLQDCMSSWKKYLPDYEIRRWDYERFPKGKCKWVDDAFSAKKYAFAADYIRCYALYHEGGIYLDSDVEVLKSFDPLLTLPYFIGKENDGDWEAAVMGSTAGNSLFEHMLHYYENRSFITQKGYDMTPLPTIMKRIGYEHFKVRYIKSHMDFNFSIPILQILPYDYFSPKSYKSGKIYLTNRTFSIHHFAASWHSNYEAFKIWISKLLGPTITDIIVSMKHKYIREKR